MGGGNSQPIVYNEELAGSKSTGFSGVYRTPNSQGGLLETPEPHLHTYRDVLLNSQKKYGYRPALGRIIVQKKGKDEKGEDIQERDVKTCTYNEGMQTAKHLGRAICKNNLFYKQEVHQMNLIGIHSNNRQEWFITDWACVLFGLTTVPLYDTLGIENLSYCLDQTKMTTIFSSSLTIGTILNLKNRGNLQNIISYDELSKEVEMKIKENGLHLWYYDSLVEQGEKLKDINYEDIKYGPDATYTFSYTSGTTGPPKGAMISHLNMTSLIASIRVHPDTHLSQDDVHLSYLPLPHLFERGVTPTLIYSGALIVSYGGNNLKLKEDCQAVKPTLFFSVPRIFNKIVDATKAQFQQKTGISKCLINMGVNSKLEKVTQQGTYESGCYDSLVFSKVKDKFGGKVRLMLSGSAPIRVDTHSYMKILMSAPLVEGYGQTENTAAAFVTFARDPNLGHVGGIVRGLQCKLSDIPEMKYTSDDKDDKNQSSPRGEIWLRGPQVFKGYYKLDDVTKDTITSDGWLKTGDVGQILSGNKAMKIIDRKKNIFKLAQGQYVASQKVEAIYAKSPYVSEVFLHGDSTQNFAVAVVVPNQAEFCKLAKDKNIEGSYPQLCKNPGMKKLLAKELIASGKAGGLNSFENAKNIHIEPENFQVRDILTNTMKLMRFQAKTYYKKQIEDMYAEGDLITGNKG